MTRPSTVVYAFKISTSDSSLGVGKLAFRIALTCTNNQTLFLTVCAQEAYENLDSREQRLRAAEAEIAEARQQAEANRAAADLAKRNLDAERAELGRLREELRVQQAQQAAEAKRLADMQQVG